MHVTPLKTPYVKPLDDLISILEQALPPLEEGTIVAITSKIISITQGALVPQEKTCFQDLVHHEADAVLDAPSAYDNLFLTLKEGALLPNAGIDASNAGTSYILYPRRVQETLAHLWQHLRSSRNLNHLGLIMTDSRTTPLRRGVTGTALGWCGFSPLYSYVGAPDLDARPLRVTHINLIDALASAAVLVMGEGNEQTPLALITDAPHIAFQEHPPTQEERALIRISLEEDLYAPLLQNAPWLRLSKQAS